MVEAAGTARPQEARRATAQVDRRMVDLPAMLGPVRRNIPCVLIGIVCIGVSICSSVSIGGWVSMQCE